MAMSTLGFTAEPFVCAATNCCFEIHVSLVHVATSFYAWKALFDPMSIYCTRNVKQGCSMCLHAF